MKFSTLILLVIGIFFVPYNAFASGYVRTNFSDYSLGTIIDQDYWKGYGFAPIVESPVKSEPNALKMDAAEELTDIYRDFRDSESTGNLNTDYNKVSFSFMITTMNNEALSSASAIIFNNPNITGSSGWSNAFCVQSKNTSPATGRVRWGNNSSCQTGVVVLETVQLDTWYYAEINYDWYNNVSKARIDNNPWSSDVAIDNTDSLYIATLKFHVGCTDINTPVDVVYFDDLYIGTDSGDQFLYDYIGWGSDLFDVHYFYPIIPSQYEAYGCVTGVCEGWNYTFPVAVGQTLAGTWGLLHDTNNEKNYYDNLITLEELDAERGNVTYTFVPGTDIDFTEDDDQNFWIYVNYPSLASGEQKFYHLRYHNADDTTQYAGVYFSLIGDDHYWEPSGASAYDTCEQFDSTWSKAICHMIVPPSGYFPGKFNELKTSFNSAFPMLVSITSAFNDLSNTIYNTEITTPVKSASASWNGVSVQMWDMSIIEPYAETFRGYMSLILWLLFIFWIMNQTKRILMSDDTKDFIDPKNT